MEDLLLLTSSQSGGQIVSGRSSAVKATYHQRDVLRGVYKTIKALHRLSLLARSGFQSPINVVFGGHLVSVHTRHTGREEQTYSVSIPEPHLMIIGPESIKTFQLDSCLLTILDQNSVRAITDLLRFETMFENHKFFHWHDSKVRYTQNELFFVCIWQQTRTIN